MFGHKEKGAPDYAPVLAWMVWLLARRADFHSGGPLTIFGAFKAGTGNGAAVDGEGSGEHKQTELFHVVLAEGFDPFDTGLHSVLGVVLHRSHEHHFATNQCTEVQRAGAGAVIGAGNAIVQASHADTEVRCCRVFGLLERLVDGEASASISSARRAVLAGQRRDSVAESKGQHEVGSGSGFVRFAFDSLEAGDVLASDSHRRSGVDVTAEINNEGIKRFVRHIDVVFVLFVLFRLVARPPASVQERTNLFGPA